MRNITDLINEAKVDFPKTHKECEQLAKELGKQFITKTRELENTDDISFMSRELMRCLLAYLLDNMLEHEVVGIGDALNQICKDYDIL